MEVDGLGSGSSDMLTDALTHLGGARSALRYGLAAAVLWAALALVDSGTTFHIAPAIVAAAPAVTARLDTGTPAPPSVVATLVAAGVALATVTAVALGLAGALGGPALIGGSAVGETIFAVGIGGLGGAAAAAWPGRRTPYSRGIDDEVTT